MLTPTEDIDETNTNSSSRIFSFSSSLCSQVSKGKSYDLSSGWWPGMPVASAHPPFQVNTYRTPPGMRADGLIPPKGEKNTANYGFISEVISTTSHAGTHIDALCHVTDGDSDSWHGGHSIAKYLGDFGPLRDDASKLGPFITRGVMLDIPAAMGCEALEPGQPIGSKELMMACDRQNITLQKKDTVLIRTGFMKHWPNLELMSAAEQPGLSLEGAIWLHGQEPLLIGADNTSVEVSPSNVEGEPQPVHRYCIRMHGLYLIEWVYLEDLAADGINEFLFIALPLPIQGATGSLVRPMAII